jgi:hypothetical protein
MRLPDWRSRLDAAIRLHRQLPFRWGGGSDSHDCCTFPASCVDAMTGGNCLTRLQRCYFNRGTALRFIHDHGGLELAISSFLGPARRTAAADGSAVLVGAGTQLFAGMLSRERIYVATVHGLLELPAIDAIAHWEI